MSEKAGVQNITAYAYWFERVRVAQLVVACFCADLARD